MYKLILLTLLPFCTLYFAPYNTVVANLKLRDWAVLLPDPHFPKHNRKAISVANDIVLDIKPRWTVCTGDLADFDCLSTYARYESRISLEAQFAMMEEWFDELASQGTPLTHLLEGNHEERARRPGSVKRELFELVSCQKNLNLEKRKIRWVPYSNQPNEMLRIRGLTILHGLSHGKYAAFDHATDWGNCAFSHTHRIQLGMAIDKGKPVYGWNIGWLGDAKKFEYMHKGRPRGWQNAVGVFRLPKSGRVQGYIVRIDNGKAELFDRGYQS